MSLPAISVHVNGGVHQTPMVSLKNLGNSWTPVPETDPRRGWFLYAGDGQQAVRVLDDLHSPAWNYQSRTIASDKIKIALTNMTYPFWFLDDGFVRESKTIARLDMIPDWIQFIEWLNGPTNLKWLVQPGTGYADTDDPDTNPYSDPIKWQSLDWGNNLRRVLHNPNLLPKYTQVEVMDYYNPPVYSAILDRWYIGTRPVGIEETPHLMVVQTLVGHNPLKQSYGPVADKGEPGGAGKVITPAVMRYPAIHETEYLYFYPAPPFEAKLYPESLMIDGTPATCPIYRNMIFDALCFTGFRVLGRSGGSWYLLEEMLMRGDINDKSLGGTWKDWRIKTDYGGHPPPCSLPQDIGWRRP